MKYIKCGMEGSLNGRQGDVELIGDVLDESDIGAYDCTVSFHGTCHVQTQHPGSTPWENICKSRPSLVHSRTIHDRRSNPQ